MLNMWEDQEFVYFAYSKTMSEKVFTAYFHVGYPLKHQENAYLGLETSFLSDPSPIIGYACHSLPN